MLCKSHGNGGAEDISRFTKSHLMHIALWSEDDLKQLSNWPVIPIFERNEISE